MSCNSPRIIKNPSPNSVIQSPTIMVPCNKCLGCKKDRAKRWCQRMVHESRLPRYQKHGYGCCFITLTYDDKHLPWSKKKDGSNDMPTLQKDHVQKFLKRLRYFTGKKIRYYACGEYGTIDERPHYHLILFGEDFTSDKEILPVHYNVEARKYMIIGEDRLLYRSEKLKKSWKYGHHSITSFSSATAMYVAKYLIKIRDHYQDIRVVTGAREDMFSIMSRKPGLGYEYYKKYGEQWFGQDVVRLGGMKMKPDRYYEKQLEKDDPVWYDKIKKVRIEKAIEGRKEFDIRECERKETYNRAIERQKRRK